MKHLKHQSLQKISILLLTWTVISSACFITDCPRRRGKKNSFSENVLTSHGSELRQCSLCGPSLGQGNPQSYSPSATFRCFGENLCCSTDFGCLPPNSAANTICALEAAAAVNPCRNHVPKCYSVANGGQCVTDGLCCNSRGKCKEDTSCSSAPESRHTKTQQTPYHSSFSENLNNRRPDVAEIAPYEVLKELGTPDSPKWEIMASQPRVLDLPTRNKIGLHTNSYYKKSHPFGRHKAALHDADNTYTRIPFSEPKSKKETDKLYLLHQFKRLSNHYKSMRKLLSDGLGKYGEIGMDEDVKDDRPPTKRRFNIDDYDTDVRLGMEEQEKYAMPSSYLDALQPWIG